MGAIGDDRVARQIFHNKILELREIETERIVGSKDRELRAVGAGECKAVVAVRRRSRFEDTRIVDGRTVAVVVIGAPIVGQGSERRLRLADGGNRQNCQAEHSQTQWREAHADYSRPTIRSMRRSGTSQMMATST